ncbi:hypothetical protein [Comamonas brasiliensis]|uniref:hypothetical protein n=1 Tax=Comamonas brasiliensis TaxID=1812482 RepID=UPI001B8AD567|nr:hypothetical protein [Comamonas sp. PE63]
MPDEALVPVLVAARLELLAVADATPANATTAMTIKDFFMIIPLNSQFSDNREISKRKTICHSPMISANRDYVLAWHMLFQNVPSVNGSFNKPDENRNTLFGHASRPFQVGSAIFIIY